MNAKQRKKKRRQRRLLLTGILLLGITALTSVGMSFADVDIKTKLANWFANKGQQSINLIETAIMDEKELQKKRLKEELELEKSKSEKELSEFTLSERDAQLLALRQYTDEIISKIDIDVESEKYRVQSEIESVLLEAMDEIELIAKPYIKSGTKPTPTPTPTPVPQPTKPDEGKEAPTEDPKEPETGTPPVEGIPDETPPAVEEPAPEPPASEEPQSSEPIL